jgi:hypothetical protein
MRPIQHAVPGAIAELMRVAPLSPGKVAFAWRTAVGLALERVTTVRLDGHVLLVEAATPQWAREIRRSADAIRTRLIPLLGSDTVSSITVRTTRNLAP